MKVLIFGGNGFLGKEISELLIKNNFEVFPVSRNSENKNLQIDISNYQDFQKLRTNFFDIIINCATILPNGNYLDNNYLDKIYQTNILGSQNICKWIDQQNSIKKVVNCSTLAVVSKPWEVNMTENVKTYPTGNHVLYCGSKLMQELIFDTFCKQKNINLVQLRFSALYGKSMSWNGIICNFIEQARQNKKIKLSNGNKVFADFLNVEDAAKIILVSIKNNETGIINSACGVEVSLLKLAQIVVSNFDETIEIENIDENDFQESRAKINIDKLKKIINLECFLELKMGIKQMIYR